MPPVTTQERTCVLEDAETRHAPLWRVVFIDDPVSTFELVCELLTKFFGKAPLEALKVAFEVDRTGSGLAGVYPKEKAEFKAEQATSVARGRGYPLKVVIEPED